MSINFVLYVTLAKKSLSLLQPFRRMVPCSTTYFSLYCFLLIKTKLCAGVNSNKNKEQAMKKHINKNKHKRKNVILY